MKLAARDAAVAAVRAVYLLCAGLLFCVVAATAPSWRRKNAVPASSAFRHLWCFTVRCCCSPPFLSDDPLFYLAIGKVLHAPDGSLDRPCSMCWVHDALLKLPSHWRHGTSAYRAGFHALTWLIESIPHAVACGQAHAVSALVAGSRAAESCWPRTLLHSSSSPCVRSGLGWTVSTFAFGRHAVRAQRCLADAAVHAGCRLYVSRLKQRFIVLILWRWDCLSKLSALSVATFGLSLLRRHVRPLLLLALTTLVSRRRLRCYARCTWKDGSCRWCWSSPDLPRGDHCTRSLECLPRSILRYG